MKPKTCDLCKQEGLTQYVDGKTFGSTISRYYKGPWANMCLPCFALYGVGIGLGKGQYYISSGKEGVCDIKLEG
jgi:hypothetical protein